MKDLNYYKKKRNDILFFILLAMALIITIFILLFTLTEINSDIILSILLVTVIVSLFLVNTVRGRVSFYNMNYQYLLMVNDNLGVLKLNNKIYTKKWLDYLIKTEFSLGVDNNEYSIYYKFEKRNKQLSSPGHTLLCIIVSKISDLDFYRDTIDGDLHSLYTKYEKPNRVKKQIVIQFQKHEKYTKETKELLDQVICYKERTNYLININVGYFTDGSVYFLRPLKRYPNKAYYYAVQLINKIISMQEEVQNE